MLHDKTNHFLILGGSLWQINVNKESLEINGLPDAIFKMLVVESGEKPKLGMFICQLLFVIDLQYLAQNNVLYS